MKFEVFLKFLLPIVPHSEVLLTYISNQNIESLLPLLFLPTVPTLYPLAFSQIHDLLCFF